MKYLVVLLVLVVAIGVWRSRRAPAQRTATPPPPAPQHMLACHHCGVHVPRAEALMQGPRAYCCAEHRRQHSA